jgi:hypothetical protein
VPGLPALKITNDMSTAVKIASKWSRTSCSDPPEGASRTA